MLLLVLAGVHLCGEGRTKEQDVDTGAKHLFGPHGLVAKALLVQQKSASSMTNILMSFSREERSNWYKHGCVINDLVKQFWVSGGPRHAFACFGGSTPLQ